MPNEKDVEKGVGTVDASDGRATKGMETASTPDTKARESPPTSEDEAATAPAAWDWKTDPHNPHNWSARRKWAQVAMMAPIAFVS